MNFKSFEFEYHVIHKIRVKNSLFAEWVVRVYECERGRQKGHVSFGYRTRQGLNPPPRPDQGERPPSLLALPWPPDARPSFEGTLWAVVTLLALWGWASSWNQKGWRLAAAE